jgi:outer membrane protein TolC
MSRAPLAVLFVGLAAGCADIDAARRAQDPATRRPGERTASAQEVGLGPGAVLTLDQGVKIALVHTPPIALARARAEQTAARLEEVNAGFLPQIALSADYRWERSGGAGSSPPTGSTVGHTRIAQVHGESATLNQLIFDWGKTNALSRQAFDNYVAAQADLQAAEDDAVFAIKQAFFNTLKQDELVRVGEETVRGFEKHLEQVKGFVEVETRQKYDLTKAQVDLGNAQLALVRARTALTVARATLNGALGLAEEPRFALEKPPASPAWTATLDDALAQAREYQPRLRALVLRESAARQGIDAAIADFWPQITLQGTLSASGSLTPLSWFSFLGPTASWLLFSGWEKTGALREAVAVLRQAYAQRAQEEQQIFIDLHQAYATLEDTQESLKILSLTVKSAEESLVLVSGRYKEGKASSIELTDAQVALANARAAEIQARYDFEIAIVAIQRSMGGILKR